MKKFSQEDLLSDPFSDAPEKEEIPKWSIASFKSLGEFGAGDERHGGKHDGIDLGADRGTPIHPMMSGTVLKVYKETKPWKEGDPKQGNAILIDHGNNIQTFYAHLQSINVSSGAKVNQDTIIGTVGNSGNARVTSPHVHFEVRKNNIPINPRGVIGKSADLIAQNAKKQSAMAKNLDKNIKKLAEEIEEDSFWEKLIDKFKKPVPKKEIAPPSKKAQYNQIINEIEPYAAGFKEQSEKFFKLFVSKNPYINDFLKLYIKWLKCIIEATKKLENLIGENIILSTFVNKINKYFKIIKQTYDKNDEMDLRLMNNENPLRRDWSFMSRNRDAYKTLVYISNDIAEFVPVINAFVETVHIHDQNVLTDFDAKLKKLPKKARRNLLKALIKA